jgi:hypothetical protein
MEGTQRLRPLDQWEPGVEEVSDMSVACRCCVDFE